MNTPLDQASGPTPLANSAYDPIVGLLERLERLSERVAPSQRGMAEDISKLLKAAREPGTTQSAEFRTQVAYLLQDFPKFSGSTLRVMVNDPLGQELADLALTYPGLENRAVQSLIRATTILTDRSLISDIRRSAATVAQQGTGRQNSLLAEDEVRRLQPRVEAASLANMVSPSAGPVPSAAPAPTPLESPLEAPGRQPPVSPSPAGPGVADRPPSAQFRAEPSNTSRPSASAGELHQGPVTETPAEGRQAPVAGRAGAAVRTVLGDRFAAVSARVSQEKVAELMKVTEAAGTAAAEALGAFHKGPGKEFIAKIEEAATQDPGGMDAVIAGMTPGGQYSGLRREFEDRLKNDRSFVQAYNDVERTVEKYGRKRVQTTEEALRREIDVAPIDAKFQQSDAEVARHLRGIPGREPGRSMLQELTQQAMQVLTRAFQVVQDLLARNPKPDRRPSPGPSPS